MVTAQGLMSSLQGRGATIAVNALICLSCLYDAVNDDWSSAGFLGFGMGLVFVIVFAGNFIETRIRAGARR